MISRLIVRLRSRLVVPAVLLALFGAWGNCSMAAELQKGDQAPDFAALGIDGEPVKLSSYHGKKNVVLVFSRAHW